MKTSISGQSPIQNHPLPSTSASHPPQPKQLPQPKQPPKPAAPPPDILGQALQKMLSGQVSPALPWNADLTGYTGGRWDGLHATNFRSSNPVWNSVLRGINNTVGLGAGLVNTVNNLGGVLLVELPAWVNQQLRDTVGVDVNELAMLAQSSIPIPIAQLACAGLAQASEWSSQWKLRVSPHAIDLGTEGLAHITERHVAAWPDSLPKSLFFPETNFSALAEAASRTPIYEKEGSRLVWIVDAKRLIGIDRQSMKPTSFYTVIVDQGSVKTMFPGRPIGN